MKFFYKIIFIIIFVISFSQTSEALIIESPNEGTEVYAGSQLTVIVKPDSGEKWEEVILGLFPMPFNDLTNEYKETITIPNNLLGFQFIYISAVDKLGNEIELQRKIIVKMPPDVVLQSIVVYPEFIVLYTFPPDSNTDEIDKFGKEKLQVDGYYSDNVKRDISSPESGTTYESKNENIVTVTSEGLVTTKSEGKTTIKVTNGNYSKSITVVVKPVLRWNDGKIRFH